MRVYLDIETIPTQDLAEQTEIKSSIKPPANYKKIETIAAWLAESGEAAADKAWRDTALDGTSGELLAIGLAINEEAVQVFLRRLDEPEDQLLREAFAWIEQQPSCQGELRSDTIWVGHNVLWDLRFLFQRCAVHGVTPPAPLRLETRPSWSGMVVDTMQLWAGYNGKISLDRLCRALRIPSPKTEDADGSKVWDLVCDERYKVIRDYCARDVEAVRQIHRRLDAVRY